MVLLTNHRAVKQTKASASTYHASADTESNTLLQWNHHFYQQVFQVQPLPTPLRQNQSGHKIEGFQSEEKHS